jgi:hypothetical protein
MKLSKVKITAKDKQDNPKLIRPKKPGKPTRARKTAARSTSSWNKKDITSFIKDNVSKPGIKFYMHKDGGSSYYSGSAKIVASFYKDSNPDEAYKKKLQRYEDSLEKYYAKILDWEKAIKDFEKKKLMEKLAEIESLKAKIQEEIHAKDFPKREVVSVGAR